MVRFKNRYLVVQIDCNNKDDAASVNFKISSLVECITKNVQKYYGDFGSGAILAGLKIKYCNDKTKIAIIRVRHGPHRFVSSILPLITVIQPEQVRLKTLYTGATVKHCSNFIISYHKQFIDHTVGQIKSEAQKNEFIKAVYKLSVE